MGSTTATSLSDVPEAIAQPRTAAGVLFFVFYGDTLTAQDRDQINLDEVGESRSRLHAAAVYARSRAATSYLEHGTPHL